MKKTPATTAGVSVQLGGELVIPTPKILSQQPSSICELRALHLIASCQIRPELALALAPLAFGGER